GGSGSASFKGFARTTSANPPRCGAGWSSPPGTSSSPPPGPLPAYMPVIVASQVKQSGPTISGDTARVVVVKTSSGYAPDAGHIGSGVIVAETCGGGVLAFSSSQLTALLSGEIAPSGKGATIGAILQHGGFALSFRAPSAGTA